MKNTQNIDMIKLYEQAKRLMPTLKVVVDGNCELVLLGDFELYNT